METKTLNNKLSTMLNRELANKPEDYTTTVIINPVQTKVIEYKREIEKSCYVNGSKADTDCFERKARQIFSPIYDFLEDKGIKCILLFMDIKLGARLSKKCVKMMSSLPLVESIQHSGELSSW